MNGCTRTQLSRSMYQCTGESDIASYPKGNLIQQSSIVRVVCGPEGAHPFCPMGGSVGHAGRAAVAAGWALAGSGWLGALADFAWGLWGRGYWLTADGAECGGGGLSACL